MNCEIDNPFVFNCWKHHRGYVRCRIKEYAAAGERAFIQLRNELKLIGESQTDFYFGNLAPKKIANEIYTLLERENKIKIEDYKKWLNSEKLPYRIIKISDGSDWTLRLGLNKKKYIHFHPGRYSVFTLRIKASTLKTAITASIWSNIFHVQAEDIRTVNRSRVRLLSLPPVKNLSVNKNILRVINLLNG